MNDRIAMVIREHWGADLPELRERLVETHLDETHITDIVGPRRAGKTYLMYSIMTRLKGTVPREAMIYLNFENRQLLPLKGNYFNDIVAFIYAERLLEKHEKVYLFLDEVQRVDGWERYARSIYDEFKGRIKLFVSGSSANLLSEEYAKLLTGRHLTTTLLPLSFREFLSFKGLKVDVGSMTERDAALVDKHLREYLSDGGFPEVVLGKDRKTILSQLFTDIVSRDILSRATIKNQDVLDEFTNYLAANVSNLLSFGKMGRYFESRGTKVSVPTLITYFRHMKNAFLFFDNTIFSYKIRDRMQYPRKIYCIDNGIANAAMPSSGNMGRLCENAVAVELLRRGKKMYYWHSRNGREVDFIVKEGTKLTPIQVSYSVENEGTDERETSSLLKCMDELHAPEGQIVTFGIEDTKSVDGKKITYIPLWKFLLMK